MATIVGSTKGGANVIYEGSLSDLTGASLGAHSSTQFTLSVGGLSIIGTGTGLTYTSNHPSGGTITGLDMSNVFGSTWSGLNVSAAALWQAVTATDVNTFNALVFGGNDTFTSHADSDIFSSDTFAGYAGDDVFNMGANFMSFDSVDGGDGNDTLNLDGDYTLDPDRDGWAGIDLSYLIKSVETIHLAAGNSYVLRLGQSIPYTTALTVDASALDASHYVSLSFFIPSLKATGGAGDDIISGTGGNDVLIGNGGNDTFQGSGGADTVNGGDGNDTLNFSPYDHLGALTINLNTTAAQNIGAGYGTQTLTSIENVSGGDGNDVLTGNAANNTLSGSTGNDTLNGGDGNDILDGGYGDDVVNGGLGSDTVVAIANIDLTITGQQPTAYSNTITLTSIENILGNSNDNTLTGNSGNNILNGGDGNDTVSLLHSTHAVTIDYSSGKPVVTGAAGLGTDTYISIEYFNGTNFNDVCIAGSDMVPYDGAGGYDTVDYSHLSTNIVIGSGWRDPVSVEHIIGTNFNDTIDLYKGGFAEGGAGDDQLYGSSLSGGAGNDQMDWTSITAGSVVDGGDGNDTLTVHAVGEVDFTKVTNIETLVFSGSAIIVASDALLAAGQTLTVKAADGAYYMSMSFDGSAETDGAFIMFAGTEYTDGGSTLIGGAKNDAITGGLRNDTLTGNAGNDTLTGGDGNDTLAGGAGNDQIDGGAGNDIISFAGATGKVTVDLNLGTLTAGGSEGTDTLISIEGVLGSKYDDVFRGTTSDNVFDGGLGNDTIDYSAATGALTVGLDSVNAQNVGGGQGMDTLLSMENIIGSNFGDTFWGTSGNNVFVGSGGDDVIYGRGGQDTYVFKALSDISATGDTIYYFDRSAGTLDLSAIAGLKFIGAKEFSGVAGQVRSTIVGLNTIVEIDSNGDLVADGRINLMGVRATLVETSAGSKMLVAPPLNPINGTAQNDTLFGTAGDDIIQGLDGDDLIYASQGFDTIFGGVGHNTISYHNATSGVTVDLGQQHGEVQFVGGGFGPEKLQSFSHVIGSAFDDVLKGDQSFTDDILTAGTGNDTLIGYANDIFDMGANFTADDRIDGNYASTLLLKGDYSAGVIFNATTAVRVQRIQLTNGFNYDLTLADSTSATRPTTVDGTGLASKYWLKADFTAETDTSFTVRGGAGDDFVRSGKTYSTITGGDGNDTVDYGAYMTGSQRYDGGAGKDTVLLAGNYAAGVKLNYDTLLNVEKIVLGGGYSYKLTTNDATVAAKEVLTVDASALALTSALTFDGSAETNGQFEFIAGAGNDNLTGGASRDTFDLSRGGKDTAIGGGGNDVFRLGGSLTTQDKVDGGIGKRDMIVLDGDYSANVAFNATTVVGIETVRLTAGHSYRLTLDDATIETGKTLTIDGSALGAADRMNVNGSAETDGTLLLTGGAGDDTLTGGALNDKIYGGLGADVMSGNAGVDVFKYKTAADSTGPNYDTLVGFDFASDKIALKTSVSGVNAMINGASLSTATFDSDLASAVDAAHLGRHHAAIVAATAGDLAGDKFLIVDQNGVAGYQAGQDIVILLDHAQNIASFDAADFR